MSARRTALRTAVAALSLVVPAVALAPSASASAATSPSFTKIQGAAGNAAGLQPTVDAYRALLGGPDNGSTPGSQPGGRREINWDAVPDAISTPALMPPDLFNTAVTRGAVFANNNGNRFAVSASGAGGVTPRFGNVNPQYDNIFRTFSPQKLFSPVGTTQTRVRFFEPGTNNPAYVKGFGAVFTDVDKAASTKVELYDQWGGKLWTGAVPRGTTAGKSLSFLGVKSTARVYEVRITSGNTPLSQWNLDGGPNDVVAIDDLIYGEPKP